MGLWAELSNMAVDLKRRGRHCETEMREKTVPGDRKRQRLERCSQRPGLPAATRELGGQGRFYPESQREVAPRHLDFRLQASGL